jgi:hypothetical protein
MLANWSGGLRIDALLWLVCLACLVAFIDVMAREPYADYQYRTQPDDGFGFRQERFRWRPLSEDEEKQRNEPPAGAFEGQRQNQPAHYPPSVMDYADTPPGLPRGVYRPVEQRHTITPHKAGYRFRTLTPDEQQRIKRRNETYNQSWQPKQRENRSFPSSDGYSYAEPRRQGSYRFRPDKRLDNKPAGNWQRSDGFPYNPAFTDAYQAPMFRPE